MQTVSYHWFLELDWSKNITPNPHLINKFLWCQDLKMNTSQVQSCCQISDTRGLQRVIGKLECLLVLKISTSSVLHRFSAGHHKCFLLVLVFMSLNLPPGIQETSALVDHAERNQVLNWFETFSGKNYCWKQWIFVSLPNQILILEKRNLLALLNHLKWGESWGGSGSAPSGTKW